MLYERQFVYLAASIHYYFHLQMKKALTLLILTVMFSCQQSEKKEADTNANFDSFKNSFIERLWELYPGWAAAVGYHKYDSILVIPDQAFHSREVEFARAHLDSLAAYPADKLSANNKTDHVMIMNALKYIEWNVNSFKDYEWNPASWNVCGSFGEALNGTYAPLEERLRNMHLRMQNVPAYYEEAKRSIKNPTAEHTLLGIDQNTGGAGVFETDIPDSVMACAGLSASEKEQMTARSKECAAAVHGYAAWLKEMKNENPRTFRLGRELYDKKFEFDIQSGYSPEQIYQKALTRKKELHSEMHKISASIWNKYFEGTAMPSDSLKAIKMMIDKLSATHVHRDSFQLAIEKQIPELEKFVTEKNLIYLDPKKPLVVRKEPAYMAGVAGASISAPGPYDKDANTFYNVGSLTGWPEERAESYLREYNHYVLQILNIHEAVPGHYTQLIYSNQSPSIIKSVFGNGAMIEGWAVYTERMMLENGYGNNEPEMWLMYNKWHLRAVCNTILDYSVHVNNMSKEDALHLLIDEAFQQKAEAEGKWKRCTLTQVQLCSYFTGYTEIYDFREDTRKKEGDKFDLKSWHEKFLSYGSAPVKEIRKLMEAGE